MKSTKEDGSIYDYSKPVDLEKFAVFTFTIDRGSARLYRNGELAIEKLLEESPELQAAGHFSIGQKFTDRVPSGFLHGDISEMMIFEQPLTEGRRKNVEGYLSEKFSSSIVRS